MLSGSERAYLSEALASNHSRELAVPAFFAATIIGTGLLFSGTIINPINPQVMDITAGLGAFVVFIAARFLKASGRGVNLAIWTLAGILAASAPQFVIIFINGKFDELWLTQWPLGLVSYSVNVALWGLLWSGFRTGSTRLKRLKESLADLEQSEATLKDQLWAIRGEIRESVVSELATVSNLLDDASSSNATELAASVMTAIDKVIRPLSHRLAKFGLKYENLHLPKVELPRKGVAWSRLAGPEFFLGLFAIFILPSSLLIDGLQALITISILLVVQVTLLTFIEQRATKVFVHRGLGILLNCLLAGIFMSVFVITNPGDYAFGIGFGFLTVSFAISCLLALVSKRVDTLARLAAASAQKQAQVATLRQEVWVTKTALAKAIHGSVQAKFLAVALRLKNSKDLSKADLAIIKDYVSAAAMDVTASLESSNKTFSESFKDYRDVWGGAMTLTLRSNAETEEQLDANPITRSCVLEAIGEAVANAAKHSKSPVVTVTLEPISGNEVSIAVSSLGSLSGETTKSGYGSQILDEVTNSWSLSSANGRVILKATFQLLAK